ncbi:MAG: hypothetical protein ACM3WV_11420 [Bacillota bacterium]
MRKTFLICVFLLLLSNMIISAQGAFILSSAIPGTYALTPVDSQKTRCDIESEMLPLDQINVDIPQKNTINKAFYVPIIPGSYNDVLADYNEYFSAKINLGEKDYAIYTGKKTNKVNEKEILTFFYGIDINNNGMLEGNEYKMDYFLSYDPDKHVYYVWLNKNRFKFDIPYNINGMEETKTLSVYMTYLIQRGWSKLWLEVDTYFSGRVLLSNNIEINIAIMDGNNNGVFNDKEDLILVDSNKNSRFEEQEAMQLRKEFKIGKGKYRFALDGPYPTKITVEPAPEK